MVPLQMGALLTLPGLVLLVAILLLIISIARVIFALAWRIVLLAALGGVVLWLLGVVGSGAL